MKTIETKNGAIIKVDDDDYPFLSKLEWHVQLNGKGGKYARTNMHINGKKYIVPMHRLLKGMKKRLVDHKNRDSLDNRRENLRFATPAQNQANTFARVNECGFKGVHRGPRQLRYFARIGVKRKTYRSRLFDTAEEAAREYDRMAIKFHGEFAALNFAPEGTP